MTADVATVTPTDTVGDVARRIDESDQPSGFPVTDDDHVEGFVTANDLLLAADDTPVESVMSTDVLVGHPEMDIDDASRVMLRSGTGRLPVVDDAGDLVGIISNTDVLRSQIERVTPDKVAQLEETIEEVHGVETNRERREVSLSDLQPTQTRVYADELEGRKYELQRGLDEPLVVIDNSGELLLTDGHHRTTAAQELGIEEKEAYVIATSEPVDLELAKASETEGLDSIDDIEIVDYARHPLVEATEQSDSEGN